MATIKSFTSLEQSKKLAEILPLESADMYWKNGEDKYADSIRVPLTKKLWEQIMPDINPCWSLASLLGVLPEIQGGKPIIELDDNYITYPHMSDLHTKADNLADACVAMIIKLSELKML